MIFIGPMRINHEIWHPILQGNPSMLKTVPDIRGHVGSKLCTSMAVTLKFPSFKEKVSSKHEGKSICPDYSTTQ